MLKIAFGPGSVHRWVVAVGAVVAVMGANDVMFHDDLVTGFVLVGVGLLAAAVGLLL